MKAFKPGLLAGLLMLAGLAQAQSLRLAAVFSDHAVLQAGKPIQVWGWASPGAKLALSLGAARAEAQADSLGRFKAVFGAMKSGGPLELRASSGAEQALAKDVLIGEVWMAAGQSNMELRESETKEAAADVPAANYPLLRFFTVEKGESLAPAEDVKGEWKICSPATAGDFSAVAFQFGKRLQADLKAPVGMLVSTWGGTQAELWTPGPAMQRVPFLAKQVADWQSRPGEKKPLSAGKFDYDLQFKDIEFIPKSGKAKPVAVQAAAGNWGGAWNALARPDSSAAFEIVEGSTGRFHGSLKPFAWGGATTPLQAGAKQDLSRMASLRLKIRGTGLYRVSLSQPSITDWDYYKSLPLSPTAQWQTVEIPMSSFKQDGWGAAKPFTPAEIGELSIACSPVWQNPEVPSGLYNAMVAPLGAYALTGFLWYQGEANVPECKEYRDILGALIGGWRQDFGGAALPFLVVQLPNYIPKPETASGTSWACLRQAQAQASTDLKNVGLAVALGLGDPEDIHPKHKAEVGRRLYLQALKLAYGRKVSAQGPEFKSLAASGSKLLASFDDHGRGLRGDGAALRGFEVAGSDGHFVAAQASLKGSRVELTAEGLAQPRMARYAFSNDPALSLFDGDLLPALPFEAALK